MGLRVHFEVAMGLAAGRYALLRTVDCRRTDDNCDPAAALVVCSRGVRDDVADSESEDVGCNATRRKKFHRIHLFLKVSAMLFKV